MKRNSFKKHTRLLILLLLLISTTFFKSCYYCEEFYDIETQSTIGFTIRDKNRFIFDVYPVDSFRVYMDNQPFNTYSTNLAISSVTLNEIYNEDTDQAAFTTSVCREFIFKYIESEVDTIQICFNARKEGKCGFEFNVGKIIYNGIDLGDGYPRILNR